MKFRGRYVMLMYVICFGTAILYWNMLEGNLIGEWVRTGEGQLRVGKELTAFTWLFGDWVYVFAVASAYLFGRQAFEEKERIAKVTCLIRAATAVFFLIQFMLLDVAGFVDKWWNS